MNNERTNTSQRPGVVKLTAAFATGTVALLSALALAAPSRDAVTNELVPRQLQYRGHLDQDGAAVTGTRSMTFAICTDAGGADCPWSETQSVDISAGEFSVQLGVTNAIPEAVLAHAPAFLRISVEGTSLGTQELASAPFARVAGNGVPPGSVVAFAGEHTQLPPGWALCDGSVLLQADYDNLYAAIGCTYGCAGGTFTLPDLRNQFVRGAAPTALGGGRDVGAQEADATALPNNPFVVSQDPGHVHVISDIDVVVGGAGSGPHSPFVNSNGVARQTGASGEHSHTLAGGDSETRPANVAMNYIIKL